MSKQLKVRKARSRSEWERILGAYEASGLSQAGYCRREGLSLSSFRNWRNRLGGGPCSAPGGFIEVLGPAPESGWEFELELGSGAVLRLRRR